MLITFDRLVFAVVTSAVALAGCATTTQVSYGDDCYERSFASTSAEKTVSECRAAVLNTSVTIEQITNANMNLGRAYVMLGDFSAATKPLNKVLVLDGGRNDARLALAQANIGLGQYAAAISQLGNVPQSYGLYPDALLLRAKAYQLRNTGDDLRSAVNDLMAARERASSDTNSKRYLYQQASAELEQAALMLGKAEMRIGTADAMQRAMDAFDTALKVDANNPDTLIDSGMAAAQMARLTADAAAKDNLLRKAYRAYADAARISRTAEAHSGAAKALQQMGRISESIYHFEQAARLDSSERRFLDMANARKTLSETQMRDGHIATARTTLGNVIGDYESAIALNAGNAQTYFNLADAYESLGQRNQARDNFEVALNLNPGLTAAYLSLGKLDFHKAQPDLMRADQNFRKVRSMSGALTTPAMRAEAAYYQSRIATEGPKSNGRVAIQAADFALSQDSSNWAYRKQACLARIQMGEVHTEEARFHCGVGERAPAPEAFLVQGMFFLRRAHFSKGGDQKRRLGDAYSSFSKGLSAQALTGYAGTNEIRARLTVGQGIAQYCVGFAEVGQEIINSTGSRRAETRNYFDRYHVAKCAAY